MNSILNPKHFSNTTAHVDAAAIKPLPNSRKIHVQGSRADIQVPMREIRQNDTETSQGAEKTHPFGFMIPLDRIPILQQKSISAQDCRHCAKNGLWNVMIPKSYPVTIQLIAWHV